MQAKHVLEMTTMHRENRILAFVHEADEKTCGIIGHNPRICQIRETICAAACSDAAVLIEGESGTGKELIARAFHSRSHRADRPFISINCAAIPHELAESELFGCTSGAYTGAARNRCGLIEAASGGTLFLDEIGEMSPVLQAKMLRVLQDGNLRRLGEVREVEVNFRLICATNRDVAESVRLGMLRGDLFYRISTIRIKVPPLRERGDDLLSIARHFVRCFGRKYGKRIISISDEALLAIRNYSWPGNVRELENVIEHAVLFCRGNQIVPENLPEEIHDIPCDEPSLDKLEMELDNLTMREIERLAIERALNRTGGNIKRASEILNLHRQTLYRKMKIYNIRPGDTSRVVRRTSKATGPYPRLEAINQWKISREDPRFGLR